MQSSGTLVVRPFDPDDAGFIHDLSAEVFAEYSGRNAGPHSLRMVHEPGALTLVAEDYVTPAGFVVVTVRGARAHLPAIAVARGYRGKGVGRRLLLAAEHRAQRRGARVITLETGEANLAALELFVNNGFALTGRLRRYYRTGYDALSMQKYLVPR